MERVSSRQPRSVARSMPCRQTHLDLRKARAQTRALPGRTGGCPLPANLRQPDERQLCNFIAQSCNFHTAVLHRCMPRSERVYVCGCVVCRAACGASALTPLLCEFTVFRWWWLHNRRSSLHTTRGESTRLTARQAQVPVRSTAQGAFRTQPHQRSRVVLPSGAHNPCNLYCTGVYVRIVSE